MSRGLHVLIETSNWPALNPNVGFIRDLLSACKTYRKTGKRIERERKKVKAMIYDNTLYYIGNQCVWAKITENHKKNGR